MKFFDYTLSKNDLLNVIDALLQMRNSLYYQEIELQGEGKSTYTIKSKIEKCTSMIDYFESKL